MLDPIIESRPSVPIPTYTSKNIATATADPLVPHIVLQDLLMSVLNLTVIAYIEDMVADRCISRTRRKKWTPW